MPDRRVSIPGILRMIRENRFSAAGLAAALGLAPDQLGDRLALMARQGYLAGADAGSPGTGKCACPGCCQPCSDRATSLAGYTLTEKGRRVAATGGDPLPRQVQQETGCYQSGRNAQPFCPSGISGICAHPDREGRRLP